MDGSRNCLIIIKLKSQQDKTGMNTMDISIQGICRGNDFMAFFDEAIIERCHYVNSQEERVEQVTKLVDVMMQSGMYGSNVIQITANNPISKVNAPLVRFSVKKFVYDKRRTSEIAVATNNLQVANNINELLPATLSVLENSKINYFSIIKDGDNVYAYLMLNPPHCDDYYYRIMFK